MYRLPAGQIGVPDDPRYCVLDHGKATGTPVQCARRNAVFKFQLKVAIAAKLDPRDVAVACEPATPDYLHWTCSARDGLDHRWAGTVVFRPGSGVSRIDVAITEHE